MAMVNAKGQGAGQGQLGKWGLKPARLVFQALLDSLIYS
jgi:hypothetical protein